MQYSIINCGHHSVHYSPLTYLFYSWNFVHFDPLSPISHPCPSHLSPTRDLPPPSLSGCPQPRAAQSPEEPLAADVFPPRGCAPRQREGCQMVHRSTGHTWQILRMKSHPHTQFTDSLHLTLGLTSVCPAPVDLIFREAYALFLRLASAIVPDSPLLQSRGLR